MSLLFLYVDKQNNLTEVQLKIPALAKKVRALEEENTRLRYHLEQFENPHHLMQLMALAEYSHLKYPVLPAVLQFHQGLALHLPKVEETPFPYKLPMLVGARH
jgi:hypothetical protein